MGEADVNAFLTDLAVRAGVSASTQNQALAALLFLYDAVLGRPLDRVEGVVRARRSRRLPAVLTPAEVERVLAQLRGEHWMVAMLLYGAGLRLMEALRLRVKDVDFDRRELTIREAKGNKDRMTVLPVVLSSLSRGISRRGAGTTPRQTRTGRVAHGCRVPSTGNTLTPVGPGSGSGCFRRLVATGIARRGACSVTIFMNPRFSGACIRP